MEFLYWRSNTWGCLNNSTWCIPNYIFPCSFRSSFNPNQPEPIPRQTNTNLSLTNEKTLPKPILKSVRFIRFRTWSEVDGLVPSRILRFNFVGSWGFLFQRKNSKQEKKIWKWRRRQDRRDERGGNFFFLN